jgi:hypothetical protein
MLSDRQEAKRVGGDILEEMAEFRRQRDSKKN